MAYCDLLRMTVLLAAGAATALAAITVVSATSSSDTLTLFVAAGWWVISLVAGIVLGRPARAAEAMRPAARRGTHGDRPSVAGQPDPGCAGAPLAAGRLRAGRRRPRPRLLGRRRHRDRLRPRRGAHAAVARGRRDRDRGPRRCSLLRRARIGARAGQAGAHAGPAPRTSAARKPSASADRASVRPGARPEGRAPALRIPRPARERCRPGSRRSPSRRAPGCRGSGSGPASRRSPARRSPRRRGRRSGIPR